MKDEDFYNFFDDIYCINLDDSQDRWLFFQEQVRNVGWKLKKVQRFSAIDGNLEKCQGLIPECFACSPGAWGDLRSHCEVWKQNSNKRLLIFEDDVKFCENFNEKFRVFLENIPPKWDFLHLGGKVSFVPMNQFVGKVESFFGSWAYAVCGDLRDAAKCCMENNDHIDRGMRKYFLNKQIFCPQYKWLVYHSSKFDSKIKPY